MAYALPRWLDDEEAEDTDLWSTRRPGPSYVSKVVKANLDDTVRRTVLALRALGVPELWIEAICRICATVVGTGEFYAAWAALALARLAGQIEITFSVQVAQPLKELLLAVTDDLPHAGERRKNAWAPLFKKQLDRIRFVDWMTASTEASYGIRLASVVR